MGRFSEIEIDWAPFTLCTPGTKAPYPRSLSTAEGLGDRLRFVAFAEKQAAHAFAAAPTIFATVSEGVKRVWFQISREEEKHLSWLLRRMAELGLDPGERPQSRALYDSFDLCRDAEHFARFMASAEERGRIAGEQFYQTLLTLDEKSAKLFQQIAIEEEEHIRLARAVVEHEFKLPEDFNFKMDALAREDYPKIFLP